MAHPKVGNLAPSFTLTNQKGEKVSLKDFRGQRVVLFFYPKALTPGCTTQACGIRDIKAELAKLNTVVFGISPDPVAKLQRFEDKHDLNFNLLSDEDHAIAEKYGVWDLKKFMGKEYMGIVRTSFVINEEGRLSQVFDKFKTSNHHELLIELLQSL
ncbi:thioredoxin-dependent thiol peroxidase [Simiduia curdlanivorans]|uniref:thioredoxin-dependent peroxiredoxin n=1 Tax=Simiduia curdlanivorans TaxID=1492769 RepID=A0ABV8VA36_9GAMM|nr:thioredoxin-dependent thiol peroxidase [Simiduia curdlanivorans]MDN3639748.1 thioredoxin-dependent thiol peroxidase [Simiduia curdlanivorans]